MNEEVGEVEYENRLNGELDAESIFDTLPQAIKPIINKRLLGIPLPPKDRQALSRYVKAEGYKLLIA